MRALTHGLPAGAAHNHHADAGLRMIGMVAPIVLDGPINGNWFEAYATQVLMLREDVKDEMARPALIGNKDFSPPPTPKDGTDLLE